MSTIMTGACPATTDLITRVNVNTASTREWILRLLLHYYDDERCCSVVLLR